MLRYRFGGKPKEFTIGSCGDVSLERARKRRDDLRELLDEGIDPARQKKAQQAVAEQSHIRPDSFGDLAMQWFEQTQEKRLENPQVVERVLRRYLVSQLGDMAPGDIKTRKKGKPEDFTIGLPSQAVELFRELEIRACGSEWVLPARRRGVRKLGHISPVMGELDTGIGQHS